MKVNKLKRRMGRPPKYGTQTYPVFVRVPTTLLALADGLAERRGMNRQEALVDGLRMWCLKNGRVR